MIRFRLTQNDVGVRRYFKVKRDGEDVFINTVSVKVSCPSGAVKTGVGVVEDGGAGEFFVEFGSAGLTMTEVGEHELETIIDGEHTEEPVIFWVRPEFVEGPR